MGTGLGFSCKRAAINPITGNGSLVRVDTRLVLPGTRAGWLPSIEGCAVGGQPIGVAET